MTKKQLEARLREIESRMSLENRGGDLARARAVTVGTCFGGMTELMMRRNDGTVVWSPLQPVEVVELIHQLAANIGCQALIQPREDFASWRSWNHTPEELNHYRGHQLLNGVGHPPHPKHSISYNVNGKFTFQHKEKPDLALPPPKDSNETVATEKPSKRRRVKRAAAAS